MSEATRAIALQEAVKTVGSEGTAAVLKAADVYHGYITKDSVPAAPPAQSTSAPQVPGPSKTVPAVTPAKPAAAKPAAAKPAAAKPAATKPKGKTEEQLAAEALERANAEAAAEAAAEESADESGLTEENIGEVITALLAADKRPECISLLKKFGATSKSGVKAEDYDAFVAEGNEILNGEDLTS